jgi:hypothetical protein
MRLGFLGPADGDIPLGDVARRVLGELGVERVIYLGIDGALDEVVRTWAEALVGTNPTEAGLWQRAAGACPASKPEDIDRFIATERELRGLRRFESLPDESTRSVEMVGGSVAVMVYDKGALTEEDMLPARVLIFGKSRQPLVRQVGQRWFLAPGTQQNGGTLILEDDDDGLSVTLHDASGAERRRERLSLARGTKLTVGGARV